VLFYQDLVSDDGVRASWPAPAMDPKLMIAVVLIFGELMLITAIALFFSSFSSPLLSMLLTMGLWIAGHFNADLRQFEAVVDSTAVAYLARGIYYLLPNLAPFNIKAEVVHAVPVTTSHVVLTLSYAAVYISAVLLAAMAVFRKRDFK
jgi:hypothetical protein